MTHHRNGEHQRGLGKFIALITALLIVTVIALKWAWNGAGAALFSLPEAGFMEIFALVAALIFILLLMRTALFGRRR